MMNPEIKQRWVEALRSGKYEQGRGVLREFRDGKFHYCCLGVLCDLVAPDDWDREWHRNSIGFPAQEITDEVGLSKHQAGILADMNDRHQYTFSQIADYIEENL